MIEKAVILCGGYETRMLPITKTIPKTMLPVFDKPLIQCIMEELKECGIKKVCFIVDNSKQIVLDHFKPNVELEKYLRAKNKIEMLDSVLKSDNILDIVVKKDNHMGAGYAIDVARDFVGDEPFVFCLSDEYLDNDGNGTIKQLIANYEINHKSVIASQSVAWGEVHRYGIVALGEEVGNGCNYVNKIVEKPTKENAPSNISYMGNAILDKKIFEVIDKCRQAGKEEINIPDLFQNDIDNHSLLTLNIIGDRYDIGNKLGFIKANINSCLKDKIYGEELKKYLKDLINKL